jgi:hypothetical protein
VFWPSPEMTVANEQRRRQLIMWARNVEKDTLEVAANEEEYYCLLAEKIYNTRRELAEYRMERDREPMMP